jgi:hypothetical protein
MKQIIVIDYPETFTFKVRKKMPDFEYGCEVRNKILRLELEKQNIPTDFYSYDDYAVEYVETKLEMPNYEFWYIGS